VPEGSTLQSLERFCASPSRIRALVKFYEAGSFCRYVKDFKTAATRLFGDRTALDLTAILDYHEPPASPSWASHRAHLALRKTENWDRWIGQHGRQMNQVQFATFLEDNLVDIASPDGASLLELAKNLDIKKAAAFTSAIRLDNGQTQFQYVEDVQGNSQKGAMTIPGLFVLGLAPLEGVEPYRVDARLRYRMNDGKLAIWYDLLRPGDYLKAAFESVVLFVEKQTETQVLLGTAPAEVAE
jgi:uncharacterized protein YfdQ (DUF2303 family)